ncbi:MAG: hypothetical protein HS104_31685 [Polyangiaceae bacterium]|nr:hypothetical protein [Polyangiaceae bacterium]MBK8996271.1 hypothetical protein [Myxococcales bacterium]MCE7892907.1 hypothetical protein [Sorangiineae bacterium PRO1]MCL4749049.1 hypothetical protein [Myxococcales bacterium]
MTPQDPATALTTVYAVYSVVSIGLTIWLARTLFKNGAVFLRDVFKDSPDLAQAVNRLLVVGFYLMNLGYACLLLRADRPESGVAAVEILAQKLGWLLLSLGFMHFFNMYLFHRIRRRAKLAELPPPVPYQWRVDYTPAAAAAHASQAYATSGGASG